jgi:hypothetical protein
MDIFSLSQKRRKNKKHILSMIIFNMVADGRLSQDFSIEELIDLLFKQDEQGSIFGQSYLETLEKEIPRGYTSEINELKKIFEYGQKENSLAYVEKCSVQLMNIIEKSIGIEDKK